MSNLTYYAIEVLQIAFLCALAPYLTDLRSIFDAWSTGRAAIPLGTRKCQLLSGWKRHENVPLLALVPVVSAGLALAILPFATTHYPARSLSEPMTIGILLCLLTVPVWFISLRHVNCPQAEEAISEIIVSSARTNLMMIPLLIVLMLLFAITSPGLSTLVDLITPPPGGIPSRITECSLLFAIAALALLETGPFHVEKFEHLIAFSKGRLRAVLRYGHDLTACGWTLFLADFACPQAVRLGDEGLRSAAISWLIIAPSRLIAVTLIMSIWRNIAVTYALRFILALIAVAAFVIFSGRADL